MIDKFKESDQTILRIEGKFGDKSSPDIEKRLEEMIDKETGDILLDLSKTTYISSAGIRVLILSHKRAVKNNKRIIICRLSPRARDIIETVGILSLFAPDGEDPCA